MKRNNNPLLFSMLFMLGYREINVNPKHRKTGDCSTRAITSVLGISYQEVLKLQYEEALKTSYDTASKQVTERILAKFGYVKMKQPRKADGTKYLVAELDQLLTDEMMKNGVLVSVAHHNTCIKEGYIIDIWNCSYKTVGNYYVKA